MLHENLLRDVIGVAIAVLYELRPGLEEKLYENTLVIELRSQGHLAEQQQDYADHYRGQGIDALIPDLIVNDKMIFAPKWSRRSMTRTSRRCSVT
jgi:GxxExxY protein